MPIVSCTQCKKNFNVKPYWIKIGYGRYCSLACKYKGTQKGVMVSCSICSKELYRQPKQLKGSKSKKYFCGKSCQTQWRNQEFIGPKHANWKHGKNVYRSVLSRNKIPSVCTLCKSNDTRILAVHHVDRDRANNKLENLAWLCHNCHFLVHHDTVERTRFMVEFAKR